MQNEYLDCPFSIEEIINYFNECNLNAAVGLDGIPLKLFKTVFELYPLTFQKLVNDLFIYQGAVPLNWLIVKMILLPKVNLPKTFDKYRTISVIKAFMKVMLGLTNKRLYNHLANKLSIEQAGFINKMNSNDQIMALRIGVLHSIEVNLCDVYVALMDFTKVFDTVWHNALLYKMYKKGINGRMWRFYKFIYDNCKARVMVNGIYSEIIYLLRCILQGGESSPCLFDLMVDDVITLLKRLNQNRCVDSKFGIKLYYDLILICLMFADDLALCATSLSDIQHLINVVCKWSFENSLEFNPIKCKVLKFTRKIKLNDNFKNQAKLEKIILPTYSNKNECKLNVKHNIIDVTNFSIDQSTDISEILSNEINYNNNKCESIDENGINNNPSDDESKEEEKQKF